MNIHFMSQSCHWSTPQSLYEDLDREFHFDFDPCPLQHEPSPLFGNSDGLSDSWDGKSIFCNPPYGRGIGAWIEKGYKESLQGKTVVFLIPSRTDTQWWHKWVMRANEIRFIKGRLKFGKAKYNAPFPSCIAVWRGGKMNYPELPKGSTIKQSLKVGGKP